MAVPGSLDRECIVEPAREVPIVGRSEVLVVGGGPAGVTAALAAALALRQGVPPSQLDPALLVRQLVADGVRL